MSNIHQCLLCQDLDEEAVIDKSFLGYVLLGHATPHHDDQLKNKERHVRMLFIFKSTGREKQSMWKYNPTQNFCRNVQGIGPILYSKNYKIIYPFAPKLFLPVNIGTECKVNTYAELDKLQIVSDIFDLLRSSYE